MGRLERNRVLERDRAVLERILALLLALAALADRAAGLSVLKRLQVLAILGRGEAEARILILGMAYSVPVEVAAALPPAAGDAGRLAASFRMLALALNTLLAQVRGRSPCRHASPVLMPGRKARKPGGWRASPALPAPDTS